jgi:hypothetical protein
MQLTPRQLNALIWLGIGVVLMEGAAPLAAAVPENQHLLKAGAFLLSPIGVAIFVVGLYRMFSKGGKAG